MIRHLHPTDSPSLLQFKQAAGPDEVFTLAEALKGNRRSFPLVKYTSVALSPRAWQSCWVQTRRTRVRCLLRAGPRSGPEAWEVSQLYLAKGLTDEAWDVLEQIATPAGRSGARRVFVRLPAESPLYEQARMAGYEHAYSESVYRAASAASVVAKTGVSEEGISMEPLDDDGRYGLFRLYCSATPVGVRAKAGQTLDEWLAAEENPARKPRDWVLHGGNGSLEAHVRTGNFAGGRFFSVMCSRNAPCGYEQLVAAGASDGGDNPVFTAVPAYNDSFGMVLESLGFTQTGTYDVLVKTLAVRVSRPVGAVMAAGS